MPLGEITTTASFVEPVSPLPDAMMPGVSVATVLAVGILAVAGDRGDLRIVPYLRDITDHQVDCVWFTGHVSAELSTTIMA